MNEENVYHKGIWPTWDEKITVPRCTCGQEFSTTEELAEHGGSNPYSAGPPFLAAGQGLFEEFDPVHMALMQAGGFLILGKTKDRHRLEPSRGRTWEEAAEPAAIQAAELLMGMHGGSMELWRKIVTQMVNDFVKTTMAWKAYEERTAAAAKAAQESVQGS